MNLRKQPKNNVSYTIDHPSDDLIYFNIVINNPTIGLIKAYTNITFNQALLDNPSEWKMGVQRFTIPTSNIPIFFFQDNTYIVTLNYNGQSASNYLTYPALNKAVIAGSAESIYSVEAFLESLNIAIYQSYCDLGTNVPPGSTYPPFFTFQSGNQETTYYCQQGAWYPDNPLFPNTNTIKLCFNQPLLTYFQNFFVVNQGFNVPFGPKIPIPILGGPTGFNFEFLSYDKNGTNDVILPLKFGMTGVSSPTGYTGISLAGQTGAFYQMNQEKASLYTWYDISRILITSSTMPIRPESSPSLTQNVTGEIPVAGSNVLGSQPIIEDFEIPKIDTLSTYYTQFYGDGLNLRWIDLFGNNPQYSFDITLLWQDKYLYIHELDIAPNNSMSFKVVFAKRSFLAGRGNKI